MKTSYVFGLLVLSVSFAVAGCTGGATDKKGSADQEYEVKGKVVAVDKQSVTLDHEAIPALDMNAMTMKYRVESPKLLEGIKTGEQVRGRFKKQDGEYTILRLEKLSAGAADKEGK